MSRHPERRAAVRRARAEEKAYKPLWQQTQAEKDAWRAGHEELLRRLGKQREAQLKWRKEHPAEWARTIKILTGVDHAMAAGVKKLTKSTMKETKMAKHKKKSKRGCKGLGCGPGVGCNCGPGVGCHCGKSELKGLGCESCGGLGCGSCGDLGGIDFKSPKVIGIAVAIAAFGVWWFKFRKTEPAVIKANLNPVGMLAGWR